MKFFKNFSIKIFNLRLPLIYIIFNYFYRKFILNKNIQSQVKDFHEKGYCKLNVNLEKEINELVSNIKILKQDKKGRQEFLIDDYKKSKIYNVLKKRLNNDLINFEKYFNLPINFANLKLFRIENDDDKIISLDNERYSRNFHNDAYLMTYFKIFINLQNINYQDGPTNYISKKDNKEFINLSNYTDRDNYNEDNINHLVKRNIGKIGDCFAMATTLCFHRASVPLKKRDMMILTLVASPKIENNTNDFFNNEYIQKAKPYNIFKTFSHGLDCYIKKLN